MVSFRVSFVVAILVGNKSASQHPTQKKFTTTPIAAKWAILVAQSLDK